MRKVIVKIEPKTGYLLTITPSMHRSIIESGAFYQYQAPFPYKICFGRYDLLLKNRYDRRAN